jgi:DNA-binding transcriptional MerR regulator
MFKIGEFSKIAHVTIRLLRYYDEIGLFTPNFIDPESGYRYYRIEQLPRLNRILVLRDLGLALEQVQEFLNADISEEEIRGMLRFRKAQLEKNIREDTINLRGIEMRLEQIKYGNHLRNFDVVVKAIAPQSIVSCRRQYGSVDELTADFETFYRIGQEQKSLGQFMAIRHNPEETDSPGDIELAFALTNPRSAIILDGQEFLLRELEGHKQMATIVRYRDVNVGLSLNALGYWIQINEMRICGPFREVYHRFAPDDVQQTIVEFQVPVERVEV